jgi:FkbM family methyltransferase
MKIMLVHNQYQQPGGEDVVFEQERRLLEHAGHHVLSYQRSNVEIDAVGAGRINLVKNLVWATDTHREFTGLLAREKPQLVHIHNTFAVVSPSVYLACEQANIPVVQTLHNYRLICPAATLFRDGHVCEECVEQSLWQGVRHGCYRDSRLATGSVALMLAVHRNRHTWDQKVHGYIALTEFARTKFVEGGLPAEKLFVKSNFVYPDPGAGFWAGKYAVFAGRLSAEKGVSTLLKAWARLGHGIQLLIIGDGPEREKLELQAAELGLTQVLFLGRLTRAETISRMKDASCLVVTSECYENFPLTIAEAFACGIPVICSRLGAMQEIVEDGRSGLYFTAGDADDLAGKVEWAWAHPDRMKTMGREARQEYEKKYTAERNYEMLADIYDRTLQSTAPLRPRAASKSDSNRRILVRRIRDLCGKAWAYSLTALQEPEQLLRFPSLCLKRVHIGEFLKLNKPWLKNSGIRTVIDVGAHTGEFSSAIRAVLPHAHVYAFEPLPECFDQLTKKLGHNGSVHVFQTALGDTTGQVEFWRSSFSKSSSLLRMSSLHQSAFPWSASNRPMTVRLGRLDDYEDKMELTAKTLLKIDVQGFEDRVLRGAESTLKRLDYVLVEVSVAPLYEGQAKFETVYDFLLQSGFSYKGNVEQLASPLDGAILQLDALFARNGKKEA